MFEAGTKMKETGYGNKVFSNFGYTTSVRFKEMEGPYKELFPKKTSPITEFKGNRPKVKVFKLQEPKVDELRPNFIDLFQQKLEE